MSKKKKKEEAARAAQQAMALQQQAAAQAAAAARLHVPKASFRVMNNCHPVPVAREADIIQLLPLTQPIRLLLDESEVQNYTQSQQFMPYGYEGEGDYDQSAGGEDE